MDISTEDHLMADIGNNQTILIDPDSECLENHRALLKSTYSEEASTLPTSTTSTPARSALQSLFYSPYQAQHNLASQIMQRSLSVVSTRSTKSEVEVAMETSVNKYSSYHPTPDHERNNIQQSRSLGYINCPMHIKPVDNSQAYPTQTYSTSADNVNDSEGIFPKDQTSRNSNSPSIPISSPTTTLSRASLYNCNADDIELSITPQESDIIPQDVKGLRKELDEKIRERTRFQKELKLSEEKIYKLQQNFDTVEEKNTKNTGKIRQLNDQIRKLTLSYEVEKQEKLSIEKHQKWLQEKSEQLLSERNTLKQEFALLKTINMNNEINIEKERKEKSKLDSECTDLKTRELKEKEAIAKTLEKVEEEMVSKETLLEELESQKTQEIQKNKLLFKEVGQLNKKLAETEQIIYNLNNELRRYQGISKDNKNRLLEYEKKNDSLKRQLSDLINENENEKSTLSDVQQNHNVLVVQKNAIEKHLEEKDNSLNQMMHEKQILESEVIECQKKNLNITSHLDQNQHELAEVYEKLNESGLEQEAKLRALQKAQAERDSYQNEFKKLKGYLENIKHSSELNERELEEQIDIRERKLENVEEVMKDINEKMKSYELEFKEMTNRELKHKEELTQFKLKIKENNYDINKRDNFVRELESNNSALQNDIRLVQSSKDEEIRKLYEEVNAWKSKSQLKETEIQSNMTIAKQFQNLESNNREKDKTIQKLKMDQQQLEDHLYRKGEELHRSHQKFEHVEKSMKEKYSKLESEKYNMHNKFDHELKVLGDRYNTLNNEHQIIAKENKDVHLQLNESKSQLHYFAEENQSLDERRHEIEQQLEKTQLQKTKEQNNFKNQINNAEANSCSLQEKIFQLSQTIEKKDEFLTQLRKQANEAFQNKKKEDSETERTITAMNKDINAMQNNKQSDDATIKTLKSRIKRLEADEKSWKNEKARLENERILKERAISNTKSKYNDLEREMKRCVDNQISVEEENADYNKNIIHLTNKLVVTEDQLRIMTDSFEVSQNEVKEMKESLNNLEDMYKVSEQRHQSEIQKLKGMYSTLEETNSPSAYRVTTLEKDMRTKEASPRFENNLSGSKNMEALQSCLANLRVDMTKIQGQMYKQAENINTSNTMSHTFNTRLQNSPKPIRIDKEPPKNFLSSTPKQKRKPEPINDKMNSSNFF